jgi:hypothetical protein
VKHDSFAPSLVVEHFMLVRLGTKDHWENDESRLLQQGFAFQVEKQWLREKANDEQ